MTLAVVCFLLPSLAVAACFLLGAARLGNDAPKVFEQACGLRPRPGRWLLLGVFMMAAWPLLVLTEVVRKVDRVFFRFFFEDDEPPR